MLSGAPGVGKTTRGVLHRAAGGGPAPERWGQRFDRPIGIGRVIEVDTSAPVDVAAVAAEVRALLPQQP